LSVAGPVFADAESVALCRLLARVAPGDLPVMICGEAGSGKEEMARYVHRSSGRSGTFVKVDCATADLEVAHCVEAARGGTLFLDEPAALPPALQGRILTLLHEEESRRASQGTGVDVGVSQGQDARLIAATSVDLGEVVNAGHFRPDLFYRLNTAQIRLVPLRRRPGDIGPLAEHFVRLFASRLRISEPRLMLESLAVLQRYSWPGQVSELRNVIHGALLSAPGGVIRPEHLRLNPSAPTAVKQLGEVRLEDGEPDKVLDELLLRWFRQSRSRLFDELESRIVAEALRFTHGNQVRGAALLGISRNVLRTLIRRHDLASGRSK
jgi:DNA-binding NtrC family response regulator